MSSSTSPSPSKPRAAVRPGVVAVQAVVLVLVASAIGVADSRLRPIRLTLSAPTPPAPTPAPTPDPTPAPPATPTPPTTPTPAPTPAATSPQPPAPPPAGDDGFMIATDRALALYQQAEAQGDVFFIDARANAEFAAGHIPRAFNIPPEAFFGGKTPPELDLLAKSNTMVIYCGGGECDASKLVAIRFQEYGYTSVFVYGDGFKAWKAAGHPVETLAPAPGGAP